MDNKDLPAMPIVRESGHPYHANSIAWENSPLTSGLTKREHFAGLAMQGLLANPGAVLQASGQSGFAWCNCNDEQMAQLAIDCADALLAQLDKGDK